MKPLGFRDALSIRGSLNYAEGYTHARLSAPAMRALSEWVRQRSWLLPTEHLKVVLNAAVKHLRSAQPRMVKKCDEPPVVVFVDGACEEGGTSVGGVLCDGTAVECFGATVPQELVSTWKTRENQETQVTKRVKLAGTEKNRIFI